MFREQGLNKDNFGKSKSLLHYGLSDSPWLEWLPCHISAVEQSDFRGKAERLRSQRKYISRCAWELTEILPICDGSEALFQGS